MKDINLLPKKQIKKGLFFNKKGLRIMLTIVIMLTSFLSFSYFTMTKRIESLKLQQNVLELELNEVKTLNSKIDEHQKKIETFKNITHSRWGVVLLEIQSTIPLGVTLEGAKTHKNALVLQFVAEEIEDASLVVKGLNEIDFVESTYLNSIEEIDSGGFKYFTFTILCSLKNEVK